MNSSAILVPLGVVVFALGMLTLAWSPRLDAFNAGPITHRHRPRAVGFAAMWSAVIVGTIGAGTAERGVLAFLVISLVGPIVGMLASYTLPHRAIVVSYALSLVGTLTLIGIALA